MFKIVEHQADLAVELEGKTRKTLFKSGIDALIYLLTGKDISSSDLMDNVEISASGFDDEERLVGLLNEFLYLCHTEGFFPIKAKETAFDDKNRVTANLSGHRKGHGFQLQREIKAVTYHNLKIQSGKIWRTKIVLDV